MRELLLTTVQAAKLLGVGPTSVKRWADAGLLACAKTAGKHRRFTREEVERFRVAHSSEIQSPSGASIDPRIASWLDRMTSNPAPYAMESALLAERARLGSWWAAAELIVTVLEEVGQRWAAGRITILDEHLASERLIRALTRTLEALPVSLDAPTAMLALVEGEEHSLGLLLAELCLREQGFFTRWAGRATPAAELADCMEAEGFELLVVAASETSSPEVVAQEYATLGPVAEKRGVQLVLGGAGAWPEKPRYGHRVRTYGELDRVLERLRQTILAPVAVRR